MSADEKLKIFLNDFEKTVASLKTALAVNLDDFNMELKDLIQNGQIQKFKICVEQSWKASKWFIELKTGVVLNSPLPVFKTLFTEKFITENDYLMLFEMIKIRNMFSHIYKEEYLINIIPQFNNYIAPLENLLIVLQQK